MWLLDKLFRRLVRHGQLTVTDYDGSTYRYGDGIGDPIAIRFTDKGAAWHIVKDPRTGVGEAYMDGRLVVEPPHDIRDFVLFAMASARQQSVALVPRGPLRRTVDKIAGTLDQFNHKSRASRNVAHHYELGREFYELFLDEDRQYSMGYYPDSGNSLEQAQLDKKALVAAKLHIDPGQSAGMHVLDIGCGWGGFALYLNRRYDCEVLGISLAPDQVAFARQRAEAAGVGDKVKFQVIDYRDLTGTFDRISSIGMIEHLGARHFAEYFAKTHELLADDGVMLTHTIGRAGQRGRTDKWSRKYIFPGGYCPALSELTLALENARWKVSDVEILRYHYAHTLAEWYRRAELHRQEITAMYDARFFRMWQFYLAGAESSFRNVALVNFHIQSIKRRDELPATRDYIAAEFARLRAAEEAPAWHLAR